MPKDHISPPTEEDLIDWADRMLDDPEDVVNLADRQKWIDFVSSEINATDKQIYWLDKARDLLLQQIAQEGVRAETVTLFGQQREVYRDLETGRFISREDYFDIVKGLLD